MKYLPRVLVVVAVHLFGFVIPLTGLLLVSRLVALARAEARPKLVLYRVVQAKTVVIAVVGFAVVDVRQVVKF